MSLGDYVHSVFALYEEVVSASASGVGYAVYTAGVGWAVVAFLVGLLVGGRFVPQHWLTVTWWRYLLAPVERGLTGWRWYHRPLDYLTAWRCRAQGHPDGSVFYNLDGDEPDMRCTRCGDDLG